MKRAIDSYVYCPFCGGAHKLIYKRTIAGAVRVTRSCCGAYVGLYRFPKGMTMKERREALRWMNA